MAEFVVLGGGSGGGQPRSIQNELENMSVMANRIAKAQAIYDRYAESILLSIADGFEVSGAHEAERRIVEERGVREEILLIDGRVVYRRLEGSSSRVTRSKFPPMSE